MLMCQSGGNSSGGFGGGAFGGSGGGDCVDLVEIRIKNSVVISRFIHAHDQMVHVQPQGYINCRLFIALSLSSPLTLFHLLVIVVSI